MERSLEALTANSTRPASRLPYGLCRHGNGGHHGPDALTADKTHAYTVAIDDRSGSASIVATLKRGDGGDDVGDADVASNRATDSRTLTPVKVNDNADRDELKDYGVDAEVGESYVLVVVECTEFGSYTISFTHAGTGGEVTEADLECVTDVDSAVLSASESTIFTTTDKLTSKITVTLTDEDGDAAAPGDTVRFKTDNCEFANGKSSDTRRVCHGQGRHDC